MAHCQLRGPLIGPLRERRRSELSQKHPVWEQARKFQHGVMTTQQEVRRNPGIPRKLADQLCQTLIASAQDMNNAIRETVDDASELRIQLEDANMAIMSLKIQETASKFDVSEAHKQIKENVSKIEDAENRLAKYHADAEKDRNELREALARLNGANDEEQKRELTNALLKMLQTQLSIRHSISPKPTKSEATSIEQALTAFHKAQLQESDESQADEFAGRLEDLSTREYLHKDVSSKPCDDGGMQLLSHSHVYGSEPVGFLSQHSFRGVAQTSTRSTSGKDTQSASSQGRMPWPHTPSQRMLNSPGMGDDVFRPSTPQTPDASHQNGHGGALGRNDSFGGPSRVNTAAGMRSRPPVSMNMGFGQPRGPGPRSGPHNFRPKAPEFQPVDGNFRVNTNGFEGVRNIDQIANTSYGQPQMPEQTQVSYPRPQGGPQAMYNHQMYYDGLDHNNTFAYEGPKRPQFGPTHYDSQAVVHRSQPIIPVGQTYGGLDDDLSRFEAAFRELFGISRGFIGTWVGTNVEMHRQAPIMQYLPKVYTGFTEQQAWSYIRQHLNDGLSRSCLFARVMVDFIVQRILVPSAWQGFDFQNDRRIQQLEEELARGPIVTPSARSEYNRAVSEIINSIVNSERYEHYREGRIEYFAAELENMLSPLITPYANLAEAKSDLRSMVGKAWSLSAKTLTSRMTFEYRFPEAGSRFSMQSMIAVAPNIDGYTLQAEHWRIQLVVTPVITVRNDSGNTLSVHVTNLAEVLLMK
ncbi:hypothetical protein SODALDRAFT_336816 [Sodiomyces alkalinus F11]|uniref:Uncharacterized protein n=1 Tax=Sodiomyces alkalinus (strain CBS 110278 / VKM F-3762 / F11) TaxID=1314773 RepID=A0A3N2Q9Q9_SODAK|nr:hypothetical protein SODALDRAFT_336816 [Sodiomyces alkalinus F11]ROT43490.1 hypothetical protein SODALDRAFT_336816 [Sodiomyces alkalinus F11]